MNRKAIFIAINLAIISVAIACFFLFFDLIVQNLVLDVYFWAIIVVGLLLESEVLQWVRKSKRGGTADLLFILFMFLVVFRITGGDLFTGFLGAFAMYLIIGAAELKGHQVINKVIYISTITYNVLFFSSLLDHIFKLTGLPEFGLLDKAFSVSFWLILVLGFVFFGRRYIVVWRFMSPQYITLAMFLLAWVLIATVGSLTGIDIFLAIYPVLIISNLIMYLGTGFLIDKFLGVKPIKKIDPEKARLLQSIVDRVKARIGMRGRVKVGYGDYPIINAMAYGPFFDKRVCVIAPASIELPEDELEAIVAHELGHVKLHHPTKLLFISTADIAIRWIFNIPATYYDFAFGKKFVILGNDVGILGFIILNLVIFAFLYIFVRVMEANADFVVKRAGLGRQLAKALYTLESFYALGQQVGLNVMLLADEKNDEDHEILQYIDAAREIQKQLVAPPRSVAVTTLLNSHPPTFLRITNLLLPVECEYTAWRAATLPVRFLRRKHSSAFKANASLVLAELDAITKEKFMSLFARRVGDSLSRFLEKLHLHGNKPALLENHVIVTRKDDGLASLMKIDRVDHRNSITTPYVYMAMPVGEGTNKASPIELIPEMYSFEVFNKDHHYRVKSAGECTVLGVPPAVLKDLHVLIIDHEGKERKVAYMALRNQVTREYLDGIVDKDVFIDDKEAIDVARCVAVKPGSSLKAYKLLLQGDGPGADRDIVIGEHRLTRGRLAMSFHDDEKYAERYARFLSWGVSAGVWVHISLKKPVNNTFYCRVTSVDPGKAIVIQDRFGKETSFPFKELDTLMLEHSSVELKARGQDSIIGRLALAIARSRHKIPWVPG